jgi:hypothetical protein
VALGKWLGEQWAWNTDPEQYELALGEHLAAVTSG